MTDQLTFDAPAAEVAAQAGMDAASGASRVRPWKDLAMAWLGAQESGTLFTADDLVASIGLPDTQEEGQNRNNVVGAWMSSMSRLGRVAFAGEFRKSARVVGHGNLQRVWRVAE